MNAAQGIRHGGQAQGSGPSFRAAFILGIALGGFFDGILLHQVLQWHHLLSGLEGERWRDIRVQILADGAFHVLMYLIAVTGLVMLLRHRHDAAARSGRLLTAGVLLGIGIWNIADIVLFHWILGIHRIRMNVDNPLLWDLLWFVVFGIATTAAGWWLRAGSPNGGSGGGRPVPAMLLAGVVVSAAFGASLPLPAGADGQRQMLVYFLPGTSAETIFAAVASLDGRTFWGDRSGQVYLIDVPPDAPAHQLYGFGAVPVSSSVLFPAACFRAIRAS